MTIDLRTFSLCEIFSSLQEHVFSLSPFFFFFGVGIELLVWPGKEAKPESLLLLAPRN